MNRIFKTLLFFVSAFTISNDNLFADQVSYDNKIVAIINGTIITAQQLRMEVATLVPQIQANSTSLEDFKQKIAKTEQEVLQNIIDRNLVVESFYEKGGKIAQVYIDREYDSFIFQNFQGNRVKFLEYLQTYGKSAREFKNDLTNQAISGFIMRSLFKSIAEIDIDEAKKFYNQHSEEFHMPKQFNLQQIVISKNPEDQDESDKKIEALTKFLKTGVDFEIASQKYNDLPNSFNIGNVSIQDLHPTYAEAVTKLKVGKYTNVIENDTSFVIIKLVNIEDEKSVSFEESQKNIMFFLNRQKQIELRTDFINKLRKKAIIQTFM